MTMRLQVVDRKGRHLPGATIEYYEGDDIRTIELGDLDPIITLREGVEMVRFVARYPGALPVWREALATDQECLIQFKDVKAPADPSFPLLIISMIIAAVLLCGTVAIAFVNQAVATFAFAVIFLVALLTLAFGFPHPTPMQYLVMRIVLALASAGFAAMLSGFVDVLIPGLTSSSAPLVKAGGALAVFVIVYFRSPAALVAHPPDVNRA